MPAPSPGELTGDRFARRRATTALVTRDAVPRHDPVRSHTRATVAGAVLAVLALGTATVWGHLDTPADWRGHGVVVAADSGALYVVAHSPDRLVPVPNLASARLVAAALPEGTHSGGAPVEIADATLDAAPRSRPVGIVDAPALPAAGAPVPTVWSVCDAALPTTTGPATTGPATTGPATTGPATTGPGATGPDPWSRPRVTTSVRASDTPPGRALSPGEGLLLRDRFGGTWLVHDGVRARVDVSDAAVVGALGLAGVVPRPTTTSLLNAVVEGPALAPPPLAGRGSPGVGGETVGAVVRLEGPRAPGLADRFAVVERSGVQEVPPLVAALVRLTDPVRAARAVPSAPPGIFAAAPRAAEIDVASYPATAPVPVALPAAPTTCVSSRAGDPAVTPTVVPAPDPDATGSRAVALRDADASGDRVDTATLPGGGTTVRAVPPGRSDAPGVLAVVAGTGVVAGIPDADTAARLGVLPAGGAAAVPPVPDTVLRLLPAGPSLSVGAATAPVHP